MNGSKLIFVEGLPGTGKTTNAQFLQVQLQRNGYDVRWIHEVEHLHPTSFFHEACLTIAEYEDFKSKYPESGKILDSIAVVRKASVSIDLLEMEWNYADAIGNDAFEKLKQYDIWTFPIEKYQEVTLDKWKFFVENVLREETIYIIDSSLFQFQIWRFMLKGIAYDKLQQFIEKLIEISKPLKPVLIYLYRKKVEDSIAFLEKIRGIQFMEYIQNRDKKEPYYKNKLEGVEGFRDFLREYSQIASRLFSVIDCKKEALEISAQEWTIYEEQMLNHLGIVRKAEIKTTYVDGFFVNKYLNLTMEIKGPNLKDPKGKHRKLIPKSDREYFVEGLPIILRFEGSDCFTIEGGQIGERWTTSGTRFCRQSKS